MAKVRSGLLPVAGGFSQMISAGSVKDPITGARDRRQFRLKLAIDESYGPPQARRALAVSRLADIAAMRDALVKVGRGAKAEYLMRQAGSVAGDEAKFNFAIASANVVLSRPSQKESEACTRFDTWGKLARAWGSQELARLYPNAGYGKKSAEATDTPRIEYLCKFIEHVPLATFRDDDYWRAMRPAREHCKTDSTFRYYAQVLRRVLKIAVELRVIPDWPLSAVCKLPIVPKGAAPVFPFLYPEEYCRLVRCPEVPIEYRVLWGFILREGLRLSEAFRIRWQHLAFMPEQHGHRARWVLDVPETKTGRALNFVLNAGTGEVLEAFRALRPELEGPFAWLTPTNLKKAAHDLRRHIERSGTDRERLLFTEGRLRRLREHDLRSTFVTWCKLAGIDNETIAQHTGHESSTMIARYNRSKATIEHLGLARYLPLDQAMGLDVAGELDAPALAAGGVPELGDGSNDARPGQGHASTPPADRGGVRLEPALQATEIDKSVNPSNAPGCPECERPLARVQAGARTGWACVSCNAAGDVEGDWLEPVTSPLHQPAGPGNGEVTPEVLPLGGGAGAPFDSGYAPGALLRARFAPPLRGRARRRGGMLRGATERDAVLPAAPWGVDYAGEGGANLVHPGGSDPHGITSPRGDRDVKPLNARNGCDPGCDPSLGGDGLPVPGNSETSTNDASCARGDSNSQARGRRNLKPAQAPPSTQKPDDPGGASVPEATGSRPGSHPGVTTPATPLELLQAARRAYDAARNWAAARALEPLIDAEVTRLAEAARAAPPQPVRLEVVRAERGRK